MDNGQLTMDNAQLSTINSALVPPSYKQTEVGVIPDDWDVMTVGDVADVKGGKRLPLGKSLSDSPTPHPYIRIVDVFQGGVSVNDLKYVPTDVFPVIRNYRIFKNDLFITVAGTLGIVGKVPPELDGANLTENADKITDIKCNQDFLLYVLMSPFIQNAIESERTLGAQPKLALTRIKTFQILLPRNEQEQQAIAAALNDMDALITALDRLIAKKRDIKQAAMQELLTCKRRLPGSSGEWITLPMSAVAPNIIDYRGRTPLKLGMEWGGGDIPALSAKNVKMGYIDFDEDTYFGSEALYKRWMANGETKKNDLIVTTEAPLGNVALIPDDRKYILSQRTILLQTQADKVCNRFLLQLMMSQLFQSALNQNSSGSTAIGIQRKKFEKLEVTLPPMSEQRAIAEVLSDMDAEIAALEQKRDKTRLVKQGLMRELLTGKTRLIENG
jgi:type I restriction enzyme, S subunit